MLALVRDKKPASTSMPAPWASPLIAVQLFPEQTNYIKKLHGYLVTLAEIHLDERDYTAAGQLAGKLLTLHPSAWEADYDAACILSRCLTVAEKDSRLPESRRRELAQSFGDQAVERLRVAIAKGFKDAGHVKKDKDLDGLRPRQDFRNLLTELEKKAKTAR